MRALRFLERLRPYTAGMSDYLESHESTRLLNFFDQLIEPVFSKADDYRMHFRTGKEDLYVKLAFLHMHLDSIFDRYKSTERVFQFAAQGYRVFPLSVNTTIANFVFLCLISLAICGLSTQYSADRVRNRTTDIGIGVATVLLVWMSCIFAFRLRTHCRYSLSSKAEKYAHDLSLEEATGQFARKLKLHFAYFSSASHTGISDCYKEVKKFYKRSIHEVEGLSKLGMQQRNIYSSTSLVDTTRWKTLDELNFKVNALLTVLVKDVSQPVLLIEGSLASQTSLSGLSEAGLFSVEEEAEASCAELDTIDPEREKKERQLKSL